MAGSAHFRDHLILNLLQDVWVINVILDRVCNGVVPSLIFILEHWVSLLSCFLLFDLFQDEISVVFLGLLIHRFFLDRQWSIKLLLLLEGLILYFFSIFAAQLAPFFIFDLFMQSFSQLLCSFLLQFIPLFTCFEKSFASIVVVVDVDLHF